MRLARGRVLQAEPAHAGLVDLVVELDGTAATAVAYAALTGEPRPDDVVVLNTTAVDLGLGTGGVHLVVAIEGRGVETAPEGHAMKLRYTPHQLAVAAVEETHRDAVDGVGSLEEMPVIVAGLHSAVAAAAIAVRACVPAARIVYVMTDGGALPLPFSRTVPALRAAGLLDGTITAGQAFGGDLEAVTLHGALAAARAVSKADVAVVAMGPGNLGTGSRWGFALIETAAVVNAAAAMGARPVLAPRLSFADPRARHQGVSHHTLTALGLMLARAQVALPPLGPERRALVLEQLTTYRDRHEVVEVDLGPAEAALRASPVELRTMGRTFADDPEPFRAAAAAGVLAVSVALND